MPTRKISLRRVVSHLNEPEDGGGFWLPNIQRPFVWHEDQICRLFDSIMREYPISTLLVWRTKRPIRRRKFIDNWTSRLHLADFYVPDDERPKTLVLDGQQRLQSLFIGLKGSYEGRELYFDVLSGAPAATEDVRFKFAFLHAKDGVFPWVKFKELVDDSRLDSQIVRRLEAKAADGGRTLSDSEAERLEENVSRVSRAFKQNEDLSYQELDGIDDPTLFTEDDVVEIFIRANSGGTRLGKSDLLYSLLATSWENADARLEDLLETLEHRGFSLERDFILKTCLVLLDKGARYEVEKFRRPGVRETIEMDWGRIADAIKAVVDFVKHRTFLRTDAALPTTNVLIPLVYLRYHYRSAFDAAAQRNLLQQYLLRASLAGAFSGSPDLTIDSIVSTFRSSQQFELDEVFGVIRNRGRSLEITEERLWAMGYGSSTIHLLFNLWYDFDYQPALEKNLPQVDHIFPQSALKTLKRQNPSTGRMDLLRYYESDRNQLANCMLLTAEENGFQQKNDTLPEVWFHPDQLRKRHRDPASYYRLHLIPEDPSLWKLDRYEDFVAARKKLILAKFAPLLVQPSVAQNAPASDDSTTQASALQSPNAAGVRAAEHR